MSDVVINTQGVIGVNGVQPIYRPDEGWRMWSVNETWDGGLTTSVSTKRFVPKVNDYVLDPKTFETWRVDSIDPVTLIPTLVVVRPANMSYGFTETDVLLGVGPGFPSETFRLYVDKSVTPYIANVDNFLQIPGTQAAYVKISLPGITGKEGRVISQRYDNTGRMISDSIPLQLAAIDHMTNYGIKTIPTFNTMEDLNDNDVVVVTIYSAGGVEVAARQLRVQNTSFIQTLNVSQRYISGISLKSPLLALGDAKTLQIPINSTLDTLNLVGVVHYSDGETLELPVNGDKFSMFGLDQVLTTIVGERVDLVLRYRLDETEITYSAVSGGGKYITESYAIEVTNPNNSTAVKLFGYPVYVSDALGYKMQWYLFNLDRSMWFDVTPFVKFSEQTGVFDPKAYGYLQRKTVTINLRDVSGSFKNFNHTQVVDIELMMPPNGSKTPWKVAHETNTSHALYGDGLIAKIQFPEGNTVKLDSGFTTYEDWIKNFYGHTYPLVNLATELAPPKPTHFVVMQAGKETVYSISEWANTLALDPAMKAGDTLFIRFERHLAVGTLQLAMAAVVISAT